MNQVQWMLCLRISSRSRSVATIPKSPREIMVGVFSWRERNGEALSRSKVRQTKCCAIIDLLGITTLANRASAGDECRAGRAAGSIAPWSRTYARSARDDAGAQAESAFR